MESIQENNDLKEEINYRALLLKTILGIGLFVIACIVVSNIFKDQVYSMSKIFIESYGLTALFAGFFLTAICPFPLPDHALSAFVLFAGVNFWVNVGISTIGSLMGGIIAYLLGKLLKKTNLYRKITYKYKIKSEYLIKKYGIKGLAIACLTPIPDSPVMWICGAMDLSFWRFSVTLFICRTIKIAYILWLFKIGQMIL